MRFNLRVRNKARKRPFWLNFTSQCYLKNGCQLKQVAQSVKLIILKDFWQGDIFLPPKWFPLLILYQNLERYSAKNSISPLPKESVGKIEQTIKLVALLIRFC